MTCNISQGFNTPVVSYAHRVGDLNFGLSALFRKHHLWHACIGKATSITEVSNTKGLHVSAVVWVHLLSEKDQGLHASCRRPRPISSKTRQGLNISAVACMYRLDDIGSRMHALTKRCHPTTYNKIQSLHASNFFCVNLRSLIRQ